MTQNKINDMIKAKPPARKNSPVRNFPMRQDLENKDKTKHEEIYRKALRF